MVSYRQLNERVLEIRMDNPEEVKDIKENQSHWDDIILIQEIDCEYQILIDLDEHNDNSAILRYIH